jgi:branched-chain amino acid transport system ATP-binding protein
MHTSLVKSDRPGPRLVIDGIESGYGAAPVVRGVSAQVGGGEIATIVGPNGSGKSTLLKTVTGGLAASAGKVVIAGEDVTNMRRDLLVRRGMGYVPQENEVFRSLSVRDNLAAGGYLLPRSQVRAAMDRVLGLFPRLVPLLPNAAGNLSGGERKMLAMGRVLMLTPRVVVLDEPSANLSPAASELLLTETVPMVAASGAAVLLVEQRALQALACSQWAYLMVAGKFEVSGSAHDLAARRDIGELFLGSAAQTPPLAAGQLGAREPT